MSLTQRMTAALSTARQTFPPSPHWTADDMPRLDGLTTAVTGGYAGIGEETCKALLEHGAHVVILGRSREKADEAMQRLAPAVEKGGKQAKVEFIECDLGDLTSVRKAADELWNKVEKLDVLFNNAGVMFPPAGSLSAQSIDMQFATNVLGHFHLSNLLVPLLSKSTRKADGFPRVVNTSSSGHWLLASGGGVVFDSLKVPEGKDNTLDIYRLYGQSKLGNVLFANEFQRRHPSIVSTSLNPGNLKTSLSRHTPALTKRIFNLMCYDPSYGALTQLWAGTSAEGKALGGKYLGPWAREVEPLATTQDKDLARRMWQWCEKECEGF